MVFIRCRHPWFGSTSFAITSSERTQVASLCATCLDGCFWLFRLLAAVEENRSLGCRTDEMIEAKLKQLSVQWNVPELATLYGAGIGSKLRQFRDPHSCEGTAMSPSVWRRL